MTEAQLREIEERAEECVYIQDAGKYDDAVIQVATYDIPALVVEVRELRTVLGVLHGAIRTVRGNRGVGLNPDWLDDIMLDNAMVQADKTLGE